MLADSHWPPMCGQTARLGASPPYVWFAAGNYCPFGSAESAASRSAAKSLWYQWFSSPADITCAVSFSRPRTSLDASSKYTLHSGNPDELYRYAPVVEAFIDVTNHELCRRQGTVRPHFTGPSRWLSSRSMSPFKPKAKARERLSAVIPAPLHDVQRPAIAAPSRAGPRSGA
jgi:hypothetical protein